MATPSEAANAEPTSPDASDEVLVVAIAQRGDRAAFRLLFQRYAGRIKAFLMRSGAAPDQAEEVAQDVMVTLWRKAAQFDPARASAATWIFTIARNRRIDRIRRERRATLDPDDPLHKPDPQESAETQLAGATRDAAVRAAMADLNPEQREVIELAFFTGLSHGEIAEKLAMPLGTVKSRLRLAFGRLRGNLGAEFAAELTDD